MTSLISLTLVTLVDLVTFVIFVIFLCDLLDFWDFCYFQDLCDICNLFEFFYFPDYCGVRDFGNFCDICDFLTLKCAFIYKVPKPNPNKSKRILNGMKRCNKMCPICSYMKETMQIKDKNFKWELKKKSQVNHKIGLYDYM